MIKYLYHKKFGRIYLPDVVTIDYFVHSNAIYFKTPAASLGLSKYDWSGSSFRYYGDEDARRSDEEITILMSGVWRELVNVLQNQTDNFWILQHPFTKSYDMPYDSFDRSPRYIILNMNNVTKVELCEFADNQNKVEIHLKADIVPGWGGKPDLVGGYTERIVFEDNRTAEQFIWNFYDKYSYNFSTEYENEFKVISNIEDIS